MKTIYARLYKNDIAPDDFKDYVLEEKIDFSKIVQCHEIIDEFLQQEGLSELVLCVSSSDDLSNIISVINSCHERNVRLTIAHMDNRNRAYFMQKVF